MHYKRILITLIAQIGEFWLQLLVNFCLHITCALLQNQTIQKRGSHMGG